MAYLRKRTMQMGVGPMVEKHALSSIWGSRKTIDSRLQIS